MILISVLRSNKENPGFSTTTLGGALKIRGLCNDKAVAVRDLLTFVEVPVINSHPTSNHPYISFGQKKTPKPLTVALLAGCAVFFASCQTPWERRWARCERQLADVLASAEVLARACDEKKPPASHTPGADRR